MSYMGLKSAIQIIFHGTRYPHLLLKSRIFFLIIDWLRGVNSSAYNCARSCAQKFYPDNTDTTNTTAYETTYNCIANCTGTSFPSWAAMVNATETATSTTVFQSFTTTTTRSMSSKSSITSTTSTSTSTTSTLTTTSSASTPTKTSGGGNVGASYGLLFAGVLGVMAL